MMSVAINTENLLGVLGKLRRLARFGLCLGSPQLVKSKRLLFLQYEMALGSAVNATSIFEAFKKFRPDLHVTVASTGLSYEVLKYNPWIDHLIETADPHKSFVETAGQLLRAISGGGRADCIVTNFGNMKKRLALLGLLNPSALQVGYTLAPELYDATLQPNAGISVLANNLRVLDLFAGGTIAIEPKVFFPEYSLAALDALLSKSRRADVAMLVVFVTQTSGGQPTRWYDDRFAAVADYLSARHGAQIAFAGTASQSAGIDQIRAAMSRQSVNLAGETDLPTLSALLCTADLVVTLDTGTMHVARAAGVPMVIIASAWQPAHEWLPLGVARCRILRRNVTSCSGCRNFVCTTRACMDEITAEDAIMAAESLLASFPPSAAERQRRVDSSCNRTALDQPSFECGGNHNGPG
jgi:ADP-heptose:LPS heptosyltransferase